MSDKGYITDEDIAKRESPDYYYVIKFDGPDYLDKSKREIKYVGYRENVNTLPEAEVIGNLECAKVIFKNMKVYWNRAPECVHIVKVKLVEEVVE